MSELKAITVLNAYQLEYNDDDLVYLKSEADKVIAELKAQKAQAEDDCAYWKMCHGNAVNAMHETEEYAMQLYRGERQQKRKRCLAMARWCQSQQSLYPNAFGLVSYKGLWWHTWHDRWLDIAEKFKPNKEAK